MVFNKKLNDIQDKFFNIFITVSYILIILSFFGVSQSASMYLEDLDYYVRIYICLFLIWRFNRFRDITQFTDLDRKIAFSAGVFILTTTILYQYLIQIREKVKNVFNINNNQTQPVNDPLVTFLG
jgi:hypothetical protein